ncbi:peptidoglycan-binding domain-containing protein [Microbacterium sp. 22215]|uniref:peptidoglycan-binding domain-containing protein n=1 Tax=Microbacterium sp. 22215 TaxID=3453893 RepID=UPI003F847E22
MQIRYAFAPIVIVTALAVSAASPAVASTAVASSPQVKTFWNGCNSTTWSTGVPTKCFYQDVQGFMLFGYYTGSVDGAFGVNSWKAMQRYLNAAGWNAGTVDGIAGYQTKTALQRLLKHEGLYTGPIDGIFGAGTYRAWAVHVSGTVN